MDTLEEYKQKLLFFIDTQNKYRVLEKVFGKKNVESMAREELGKWFFRLNVINGITNFAENNGDVDYYNGCRDAYLVFQEISEREFSLEEAFRNSIKLDEQLNSFRKGDEKAQNNIINMVSQLVDVVASNCEKHNRYRAALRGSLYYSFMDTSKKLLPEIVDLLRHKDTIDAISFPYYISDCLNYIMDSSLREVNIEELKMWINNKHNDEQRAKHISK